MDDVLSYLCYRNKRGMSNMTFRNFVNPQNRWTLSVICLVIGLIFIFGNLALVGTRPEIAGACLVFSIVFLLGGAYLLFIWARESNIL